ncbi:hypothetical protein RND81_12G022500 [Saponaria officinalis]|uniref:Uncharacterized protein n=1 Tax=Saponaria officinalis TaxID=3572 RepID=A0AAW1H4N2_SAPOF
MKKQVKELELDITSRSRMLSLDEDKRELMKNSVFYKICNVKKRSSKLSIVQTMMENYSMDKKAFLIGNRWCRLCVKEVGYLLGLRPSGKRLELEKATNDVVPEYLVKLAVAAKIRFKKTDPKSLLKKITLAQIITGTVVTETNQDSLRKLIYCYLLNFTLLPSSSTSANLRYFKLIDEIEEVNWPKEILRRMTSDIHDYKFQMQIKKLKGQYKFESEDELEDVGEDEEENEGEDQGEEEEKGNETRIRYTQSDGQWTFKFMLLI